MTPAVSELLEFERTHPRNDGRKQEAIRLTFGIGFARYHQLLGLIIEPAFPEHREALEHDAALVHRIADRRARDTAQRLRLIRKVA